MSHPERADPDRGDAPEFALKPRLVSRASVAGLVGQRFEGEWFVIDREDRVRFWAGTQLEETYGEFDDSYVPGFLLLSLLDPLANTLFGARLPGPASINYGFDRVRFTKMVLPHDELRLICIVTGVEDRSSGQLITLDCELQLKNGTPAVVARWLILFPSSNLGGDQS